ncbi:MAG: glycosyltransferase family 2 protein [Candidatus Saccharibacteria bacterium]|nr:glycosyltransferase family 2 protein [Pseudorhodobacter sp.]
MDLSIVIVNWNTSAMLRDCLHTVFAGLGHLEAEIFVVDNASSDDSLAMLAREFPSVIAIANASNLGFAAANNVALARAKGRHMLLLNTDTLVHGTVLPDAVEWLDTNPKAAVMGPRILNRDGSMQVSSTKFPTLSNLTLQMLGLTRLAMFDVYRMESWNRKDEREVEIISGCAMFVRGTAMRQVGLLDDAFFFYGEETDWCRRYADAGWKVVFAPVGEITHFGGGSVKSLNHKRDIMLTEGTVRLHKKHGGMVAGLACYALLATFNVSRSVAWSILALGGKTAAQDRARHFRNVVSGFGKAWPKPKAVRA